MLKVLLFNIDLIGFFLECEDDNINSYVDDITLVQKNLFLCRRIFHQRNLNNKINRLQKKESRTVYSDFKAKFSNRLVLSVIIIEIFKIWLMNYLNFCMDFLNEVFQFKSS